MILFTYDKLTDQQFYFINTQKFTIKFYLNPFSPFSLFRAHLNEL